MKAAVATPADEAAYLRARWRVHMTWLADALRELAADPFQPSAIVTAAVVRWRTEILALVPPPD